MVPPSYRSWTVELWMKKSSSQASAYPRVFDVNTWPSESFGYSSESGGEYFWTGGGLDSTSMVGLNDSWHHLAWTSDGTYLRAFEDGINRMSTSRARLVQDSSSPLILGAQGNYGNGFSGKITNFHITKTCKYTSDFSVPTAPTAPDSNSQLLLLAQNDSFTDSSGKSRSVIYSSNSVAFDNADFPFTQASYSGSSNTWGYNFGQGNIDFYGSNYDANLLNVKAGFEVWIDGTLSGFVTQDAVDLGGTIRITVGFNPTYISNFTFKSRVGGSYVFNGSSYIGWAGGTQWALDN